MASLQDYVEAVEANLQEHGEGWSAWEDTQDIISFYFYEEGWTPADEFITEHELAGILDRAIKSNGESLLEELPAYGRKAQGTGFPGSFWDR